MRYEVITKNNYVEVIRPSVNGWLESIDQYDFSNNRLHAYKLVEYELVFDETRYQEILQEIQKEKDLAEMDTLQIKLDDSDYVMAQTTENLLDCTTLIQFLKVFADIKKKYSEKIANRKVWRNRIQEIKEKWGL